MFTDEELPAHSLLWNRGNQEERFSGLEAKLGIIGNPRRKEIEAAGESAMRENIRLRLTN